MFHVNRQQFRMLTTKISPLTLLLASCLRGLTLGLSPGLYDELALKNKSIPVRFSWLSSLEKSYLPSMGKLAAPAQSLLSPSAELIYFLCIISDRFPAEKYSLLGL